MRRLVCGGEPIAGLGCPRRLSLVCGRCFGGRGVFPAQQVRPSAQCQHAQPCDRCSPRVVHKALDPCDLDARNLENFGGLARLSFGGGASRGRPTSASSGSSTTRICSTATGSVTHASATGRSGTGPNGGRVPTASGTSRMFMAFSLRAALTSCRSSIDRNEACTILATPCRAGISRGDRASRSSSRSSPRSSLTRTEADSSCSLSMPSRSCSSKVAARWDSAVRTPCPVRRFARPRSTLSSPPGGSAAETSTRSGKTGSSLGARPRGNTCCSATANW